MGLDLYFFTKISQKFLYLPILEGNMFDKKATLVEMPQKSLLVYGIVRFRNLDTQGP